MNELKKSISHFHYFNNRLSEVQQEWVLVKGISIFTVPKIFVNFQE